MKGIFTKPGNKAQDRPAHIEPMMIETIEISLADRVKQLAIFAKTPDELDALAEAYRKISV